MLERAMQGQSGEVDGRYDPPPKMFLLCRLVPGFQVQWRKVESEFEDGLQAFDLRCICTCKDSLLGALPLPSRVAVQLLPTGTYLLETWTNKIYYNPRPFLST